eukprot:GHVP01059165.1.p1 GENE.GHVP01059165.1~~GHVP01059165.1.p1  ORF type:complete len:187 (+),score=36.14 GHVP01059165.1:334-894(+)
MKRLCIYSALFYTISYFIKADDSINHLTEDILHGMANKGHHHSSAHHHHHHHHHSPPPPPPPKDYEDMPRLAKIMKDTKWGASDVQNQALDKVIDVIKLAIPTLRQKGGESGMVRACAVVLCILTGIRMEGLMPQLTEGFLVDLFHHILAGVEIKDHDMHDLLSKYGHEDDAKEKIRAALNALTRK